MEDVFLLAEKHNIAFWVMVSGNFATIAGLLPWKARRRIELLVNDLLMAENLTCLRIRGRIVCMAKEMQVRRNEGPPILLRVAHFPGRTKDELPRQIHTGKHNYLNNLQRWPLRR